MLIGRDAELSAVETAAAAGKSALILVQGRPRMGKSTLLRELRHRATARRDRVLPEVADLATDPQALCINKETTAEEFRRTSSLVSVGDPNTPPEESIAPRSRGFVNRPVFILIDGYRPHQRFDKWFVEDFLPKLPETSPPQIVILAGYSGDLEHLAPLAKLIITLTPIATSAIEIHLRDLNGTIRNKMTDQEICMYATALSEEPRLIDSLERLLRLKRPSNGSGAVASG